MWKSVASNALTLFIVALLGLGGVILWGQKQYAVPGPLAQAVCFKVERGASLSAVSAGLEAQGAISDARIFRIGATYGGIAGQLKFGSYLLEPAISMAAVAERLTVGGQSTCGQDVNLRIGVAGAEVVLRSYDAASSGLIEVAKFDPAGAQPQAYQDAVQDPDLRWRVTLAEGVTSWNIVEALKAADFLTGEIKAVPAEGILAPDSYEVTKGDDRSALLAKMEAAQTAALAEAWAGRAEGLPYETMEEALIMASIVEKETGVAAERAQVASVFLNRLKDGMKLQTDPTVIYGVTEGKGVLGRGLRQSELRRETPWNTYVIQGLPQTPICNPGRDAIEAALHPDATEYLYFVADGTGGHAFATTLEEHNKNVAKWRAIEAAAAEGQN
ncbi:endolytic transglycosylase MltG [Rhodobacter sp. KR11]|uniref:endolytic transglycosylase MltG n=1 Tax=Rhodobacter sp. KR11 TaxID=2974588 RepID=UPI002223237B|nr:endolytic transglycosylase MltG [Rhodobacter sp. KR11]MCW1918004.1 endolytic transglycosylase MltG [Rhodobacter sp. KR11]